MAPDKIYIFLDGDELWYKPEEWEAPPPNRVEYIRKDVVNETIETAEDHAYFAGKEKMREELMEWAKETLEILNTDKGINEDFRKGAACELEEVIKHIKSM